MILARVSNTCTPCSKPRQKLPSHPLCTVTLKGTKEVIATQQQPVVVASSMNRLIYGISTITGGCCSELRNSSFHGSKPLVKGLLHSAPFSCSTV